jgi:hypothetical protein
LPDGLFSYQKSRFGNSLEGLALEKVGMYISRPFGILCGHLEYFVAIWYSLWHIVSVLVCLYQEKSGNPAVNDN